jgi:protein-tyrosine phosphatase
LRWPDLWLPSDRSEAKHILTEAWDRARNGRVEIACGNGLGRTGTALACLAVIDGVPADQVVSFVRRHYNARAVETPWQRRYAARFTSQ